MATLQAGESVPRTMAFSLVRGNGHSAGIEIYSENGTIMAAHTSSASGTASGIDLSLDPRQGDERTTGGLRAQHQAWPGTTGEMVPPPDHGEESYVGSGKLLGRVALITGGDSGIGRAVAIAFAREGADVAIAYFDEHHDAEVTLKWVTDAGRQGLRLPTDLCVVENCRAIVADTVQTFGRIDILVNNAAYQWETTAIEDVTPAQFERTFRTNVFAYFYVAQAALPHMPAGGAIINTGSVTAFEGHPGLLDYSATKGAIHTLTKSLARAVSDRGIRVNAVSPGPVWTPLIPATLSPEHVAKFGSTTEWGRPAQPAELAPSYVFLASADSRYYTGEILAPTARSTTR